MSKKVYYIPEGIPNLKPLFPGFDFNLIKKWSVVARNKTGQIMAETRVNEIGCCCNEKDKIRLYFVNDLGEIDSINLNKIQKVNEVKSSSWEKTKKPQSDVSTGGTYRSNITGNNLFEGQTNCYGEKDIDWITELLRTPNAWIEVIDYSDSLVISGETGSAKKMLLPVVIQDGKIVTVKNKDRYDEVLRISFVMSNKNNTKR